MTIFVCEPSNLACLLSLIILLPFPGDYLQILAYDLPQTFVMAGGEDDISLLHTQPWTPTKIASVDGVTSALPTDGGLATSRRSHSPRFEH